MARMPRNYFYASILIVMLTTVKLSQGASYDDEVRLLQNLTHRSYSPHARPVIDSTSPVKVNISVNLIHFDIDAKTSRAHTDLWYHLVWTDQLLTWDPEDFGGIKMLRSYPIDKLWVPDMKLQNSAEPVESWDRTSAILSYDGTIMWVPRGRMVSKCRRGDNRVFWKVTYHCPYKIGSWVYSEDEMTLHSDSAQLDTTWYAKGFNDYEVKENKFEIVVQHYDCCPEGYVTAEAALVFQKENIF